MVRKEEDAKPLTQSGCRRPVEQRARQCIEPISHEAAGGMQAWRRAGVLVVSKRGKEGTYSKRDALAEPVQVQWTRTSHRCGDLGMQAGEACTWQLSSAWWWWLMAW